VRLISSQPSQAPGPVFGHAQVDQRGGLIVETKRELRNGLLA